MLRGFGALPSLVVAVPGSDPPCLARFDQVGVEHSCIDLPDIGTLRDVLRVDGGLLAVGYDKAQALGPAGQALGEPFALDAAATEARAWASFAGGLASISPGDDDTSLLVRRFDARGALLGTTELSDLRSIFSPVLVPLSDELLLVAWSAGGLPPVRLVVDAPSTPQEEGTRTMEQEIALHNPGIMGAVIAADGSIVQPPHFIHQAAPGGTIHTPVAQARPDGGALLAWGDSSLKRWSVFALELSAGGSIGPVQWVNRGERTDALGIALPAGGDGRWVSWGTGIHWGMFDRRGVGQVALQRLGSTEPPRIFDADGSIESHAVAMSPEGVLVIAGVHREDQYHVVAERFPAAKQ